MCVHNCLSEHPDTQGKYSAGRNTNPIFGATILDLLSASDEQADNHLCLWLHSWSGVTTIFFRCVTSVGLQQYFLSILFRFHPTPGSRSDVLWISGGLQTCSTNCGLQLSGVQVEWKKTDLQGKLWYKSPIFKFMFNYLKLNWFSCSDGIKITSTQVV